METLSNLVSIATTAVIGFAFVVGSMASANFIAGLFYGFIAGLFIGSAAVRLAGFIASFFQSKPEEATA